MIKNTGSSSSNKKSRKIQAKVKPQKIKITKVNSTTEIDAVGGVVHFTTRMNATNPKISSDESLLIATMYPQYKMRNMKVSMTTDLLLEATDFQTNFIVGWEPAYEEGVRFDTPILIMNMQKNARGKINQGVSLNIPNSKMISTLQNDSKGLALDNGTLAFVANILPEKVFKVYVKISYEIVTIGDPLSTKFVLSNAFYSEIYENTGESIAESAYIKYIPNFLEQPYADTGNLDIKIEEGYNSNSPTGEPNGKLVFPEVGAYDLTLVSGASTDWNTADWEFDNVTFPSDDYFNIENVTVNDSLIRRVHVDEPGGSILFNDISSIIETIGEVIDVAIEIAKVITPIAASLLPLLLLAAPEGKRKSNMTNRELTRLVRETKTNSKLLKIRDNTQSSVTQGKSFAVSPYGEVLVKLWRQLLLAEFSANSDDIKYAAGFMTGGNMGCNLCSIFAGGTFPGTYMLGTDPVPGLYFNGTMVDKAWTPAWYGTFLIVCNSGAGIPALTVTGTDISISAFTSSSVLMIYKVTRGPADPTSAVVYNTTGTPGNGAAYSRAYLISPFQY
jgi:hypothetical protein